MSLRQYLFTMALGTVICWVAWGMALFNIDPFTATAPAFGIFYASLYFALVGTLSLFSTPIRKVVTKGSLPTYRYVEGGFRDGAVLAFLIVALLFLQAQGWLNPLTAVTFILATTFILAFRYSNLKQRHTIQSDELSEEL